MARLLQAQDPIGPPLVDLYYQVMFRSGCLTRRERELIAAVAAWC